MGHFPDIDELIPHAKPMVLLESVINARELGLTAVVSINSESLFADARGVPAWVGLEYMGQAIAAFAGLDARRQAAPVRIGFLVSTRRYEPVASYFPNGARLEVAVDALTTNTTGLRVFECAIRDSERLLVSANLNVFMPEDPNNFIQGDSGNSRQQPDATPVDGAR